MTVAGERIVTGLGTPPDAVPDQGKMTEARPARRRLHRLAPDSDVVELLTVGIDVGSATFHMSVSRIVLERRAQSLSTRYDVVSREAVFVSPVTFTPYLGTEEIDAASVVETVRRAFAEAGVDPAEIDSGVVLLTGSALLRHNARALADRLAEMSGRFVCAAAGHHFEAVLAAHGSGAVARSQETPGPVVALDIGGATTKLALVSAGEVQATAALGVGSRLLAWDRERRLVRVEEAVVPLAVSVGVDVRLGRTVDPSELDAISDRMARQVLAQLDAAGGPATADEVSSLLTPPFPAPPPPFEIVASGGVAELFGDALDTDTSTSLSTSDSTDTSDLDLLGDLGPRLARALRSGLRRSGLDHGLRMGRQRIRATVIGASQFSTQVSGSTVAVDAGALPLHHVPVVRPPLDLASAGSGPGALAASVEAALVTAVQRRFAGQGVPDTLAVSLRWRGEPTYARLRAVAEGLLAGRCAVDVARLVVALDADVASSLGRIMVTELGADPAGALCLDNLDLADLDYVDVGRPVHLAKVVPVVVKSLLFAEGGDAAKGGDAARSEGEPT